MWQERESLRYSSAYIKDINQYNITNYLPIITNINYNIPHGGGKAPEPGHFALLSKGEAQIDLLFSCMKPFYLAPFKTVIFK